MCVVLFVCAWFSSQVKPFDSGDARKILEQQLGRPLGEIFLDAGTAFEVPVAAASLGQVRIKTCKEKSTLLCTNSFESLLAVVARSKSTCSEGHTSQW